MTCFALILVDFIQKGMLILRLLFKNAKIFITFIIICQIQYSTLLSDLQNDSDEDCFTEKDLNIELPFQDDSHFKKF